jgi:hypothetical protein
MLMMSLPPRTASPPALMLPLTEQMDRRTEARSRGALI